MRINIAKAEVGQREKKIAGCERRRMAQRAIGVTAILWIAAGTFSLQRPLRTVQTEAHMIQMAGEAVARRSEKKRKSSAKPALETESMELAKANRAVMKIVVSIPDCKLALIEDDRVLKIYPVAVGAPGTPSPEGKFRIASRLENPSWYWPGKVIPAGPANPLGPRWVGLGVRGFGIHGTNEPRTIGRKASHGCVRMRNRDVEELFRRVRVGDIVEIRGERDATLAMIFGAPQETSASGSRLRTAAAGRAFNANLVSAGTSGTTQE
jgi:lipoprotein-anchoring transpeptidase ErfK/SrfK